MKKTLQKFRMQNCATEVWSWESVLEKVWRLKPLEERDWFSSKIPLWLVKRNYLVGISKTWSVVTEQTITNFQRGFLTSQERHWAIALNILTINFDWRMTEAKRWRRYSRFMTLLRKVLADKKKKCVYRVAFPVLLSSANINIIRMQKVTSAF